METTTSTATEALAFTVTVSHGQNTATQVLARFKYESDALNFARASFAGHNGGDYTVYLTADISEISAFTFGNHFVNVSDGAKIDGFNG